jgi:hypothetical protein
MSRRSVFVGLGIVVLLAGSFGAVLLLLLHYEPRAHRDSALPAGPEREHCSDEFYSEFSELLSAMNGKEPWSRSFTDKQINSFLKEGFIHSGMSEKLLPEGISEPRIRFETERMWLSFCYRSRFIKTIVSIRLRIWLPVGQPNRVAVCLEKFQAGLVPCTAQWLLERISEVGRQNGIDVTWYRHEGYPVAVLCFQADQPSPTLQLTAVTLAPGSISIHGQANDAKAQLPIVPVQVAFHDANSSTARHLSPSWRLRRRVPDTRSPARRTTTSDSLHSNQVKLP